MVTPPGCSSTRATTSDSDDDQCAGKEQRGRPCRPPFLVRGECYHSIVFTLVTGYRLASPPSTAKLRFDGNTRAHRRPADRRRKPGPRPAQHPERAGRRNAGGRRPPRLRRRGRLGCVRRDAQSRGGRAADPAVTPPPRRRSRGLRARDRDARLPVRAVSRDRDRPEPAGRRHRPAAGATRPTRWPTGSSSAIDDAYEWRWSDDDLARPLWPVIHDAQRLLTDGAAGSRQGLRAVPVPLPRPEQEPEPAVVLDGRLRHRRQDGEVRRAAGVRPLGDRPVLAEQLEAVEVDAAVADGRGSRSHACPTPPRSPGRPRAGTASSLASRSTVPRSTPSTETVARP